MEVATLGRVAVPPDPIPIREVRTLLGKCSASFGITLPWEAMADNCGLNGLERATTAPISEAVAGLQLEPKGWLSDNPDAPVRKRERNARSTSQLWALFAEIQLSSQPTWIRMRSPVLKNPRFAVRRNLSKRWTPTEAALRRLA